MGAFFLYILIVVGLSSVAVLVMLWLRRRIGGETLRRNHEVAGFVYSVVGAIFAVTVALMLDTVHDEYLAGERCASSEAVATGTIYHLADWFPDGGGKVLQQNMRDYAKAVVGPEWAQMNPPNNRAAKEAETAIREMAVSLRSLKPETVQQQAVYGEMIQQFTALREYRYTRLYGKQYEMPFTLWFVVVFGGLTTIGFSLFFTMHSIRTQALLIFFVSALIWSNIIIISEVHYPFNGLGIIQPKAMLKLQERF